MCQCETDASIQGHCMRKKMFCAGWELRLNWTWWGHNNSVDPNQLVLSYHLQQSPESRFEQVKIEQPKMEAPKQWYPPPEAMTRPLFRLVYGKDKLLDPTTTSKKRPTTSIREVRDTDPNFKPMTIDEALAALNQPTICATEELAEDLYITPSNSDTSTSSDKTDCLDELLDWEKEVRNIKVYGTFQ